jgi:uncharacterized surface protein with fasciclin (FAS1) repeats
MREVKILGLWFVALERATVCALALTQVVCDTAQRCENALTSRRDQAILGSSTAGMKPLDGTCFAIELCIKRSSSRRAHVRHPTDPNFSTLVIALKKAELVDTLKGQGPFTVFAPTDAAFSKLPKETLYAVMADKEKLTAILTHHVVAGRLLAADVMGLKSATMLDGRLLTVDTPAGVKIGSATVDKADLEASNGVIHVIDTVLIPE